MAMPPSPSPPSSPRGDAKDGPISIFTSAPSSGASVWSSLPPSSSSSSSSSSLSLSSSLPSYTTSSSSLLQSSTYPYSNYTTTVTSSSSSLSPSSSSSTTPSSSSSSPSGSSTSPTNQRLPSKYINSISGINMLRSDSTFTACYIRGPQCSQLTHDHVTHLASCCPDLEEVEFQNSRKIRDESIHVLAQNCGQLRKVTLRGCVQLTDAAVLSLASFCPDIQYLDLCAVLKLTDQAIVEIAQSCPNLYTLMLSGCNLISQVSVQQLSVSCPQLEVLYLSGCSRITDDLITPLSHLRSLHSLDVRGIPRLSDQFVFDLVGLFPNMRNINLSNCRLVTEAVIPVLASGCKGLQKVNLNGIVNVNVAKYEATYPWMVKAQQQDNNDQY
eukprot:TRINITY_DN3959_c2_g1_i1.p1 TRINITY_DN3959_c2_g1~~TRINITY_DN3959_c2_g1_i1.p1  ORF type:complete len:434 (-),score=136.68 TRINITY_DN3959_c2_g1_i1:8-1159(-)